MSANFVALGIMAKAAENKFNYFFGLGQLV